MDDVQNFFLRVVHDLVSLDCADSVRLGHRQRRNILRTRCFIQRIACGSVLIHLFLREGARRQHHLIRRTLQSRHLLFLLLLPLPIDINDVACGYPAELRRHNDGLLVLIPISLADPLFNRSDSICIHHFEVCPSYVCRCLFSIIIDVVGNVVLHYV